MKYWIGMCAIVGGLMLEGHACAGNTFSPAQRMGATCFGVSAFVREVVVPRLSSLVTGDERIPYKNAINAVISCGGVAAFVIWWLLEDRGVPASVVSMQAALERYLDDVHPGHPSEKPENLEYWRTHLRRVAEWVRMHAEYSKCMATWHPEDRARYVKDYEECIRAYYELLEGLEAEAALWVARGVEQAATEAAMKEQREREAEARRLKEQSAMDRAAREAKMQKERLKSIAARIEATESKKRDGLYLQRRHQGQEMTRRNNAPTPKNRRK